MLILFSSFYLFIKGAKSLNLAEVIFDFAIIYIEIRSVLIWLQGAISSDVKQLEHNLTSTQFCLVPKARMHGALHLLSHVHIIKNECKIFSYVLRVNAICPSCLSCGLNITCSLYCLGYGNSWPSHFSNGVGFQ